MTRTRDHMAIDQYGHTWLHLGPHPRKGLLERLKRQHADRWCVNTSVPGCPGPICHIGWIIAGLRLRIYEVVEMRVRVH